MFLIYVATLLAEGDETTTLASYVGHESAAVHIRALETLVEIGEVSDDQIQMGWASSDLHVRERFANALYLSEDKVGLQKGWPIGLSDQERCRLALRLSTMGQTTAMISAASAPIGDGPSWPVFSQGDLEDKWTCAIASASLLSVDAPLKSLLERGDFPLSMPFVWDVYTLRRRYIEKMFRRWSGLKRVTGLVTALRSTIDSEDTGSTKLPSQIESGPLESV